VFIDDDVNYICVSVFIDDDVNYICVSFIDDDVNYICVSSFIVIYIYLNPRGTQLLNCHRFSKTSCL